MCRPRGKAKTAAWALKVIGQIYAEKALVDEADSRSGTAAMEVCHFPTISNNEGMDEGSIRNKYQ